MSGDDAWWEGAFQEAYLEIYAHRSDAQAEVEIAGIRPHLCSPILDAACGGGRHLAALRSAGLVACGFDLSRPLLERASHRASGVLARGDLRAPPFLPASFGSVLVLFTGFGYFNDTENADCLRLLGRLLAPAGRLIIDIPQRDRLIETLQPMTWRATPGGWRVEERRQMVGDRVVKQVLALPPGRPPIRWTESVRLYSQSELVDLAQAAGLHLVEVWSSLRGPCEDDGRLVAWLTTA